MTTTEVRWPLRTERLVLRPATDSALDQVLRYRNRPEVQRWLLRTGVDPESFRRAWLGTVDDPRDHSVVAELDGVVVGTGSLDVVDGMGQDLPGSPAPASEGLLGYIIDPDHAGHGFATEIAGALLTVAFDVLRLRRVTAGCFADNTASWKVLEKLGMRREQHGVRDSWHAELGWVDGYTYAILADEWAGS